MYIPGRRRSCSNLGMVFDFWQKPTMRSLLVMLVLVLLAGCVRSIEDVKSLPPTEVTVTTRSVAEVRDCLVPIVSGALATPIETGSATDLSLSFSSSSAGAFVHYRLEQIEGGTRVTVQRRKIMGDHFEQARQCYTTPV